jgi:hypothetical protein
LVQDRSVRKTGDSRHRRLQHREQGAGHFLADFCGKLANSFLLCLLMRTRRGVSLVRADRCSLRHFQRDFAPCFASSHTEIAKKHPMWTAPEVASPAALCRSASFHLDLGHRTERTVDGM